MTTAALSRTPQTVLPPPFQAAEHEAFNWRNGEDAVLFVHGFPGTPAEMRPLAQHLHAQGWTARGLLLPGFGADMPNLGVYDQNDWQTAVDAAVAELARRSRTVAVVGNSMGSMLALRSAMQFPMAALVLIAPFWRVEQGWLDLTFPLLRPFLGRMRPFAKADFSDADFRASLHQVLGDDVDLDDPNVQAAIRELPLPAAALAHVRATGHRGFAAAHVVRTPVLIIQGSDDEIVKPRLTQKFARRLPNLQGYIEVPGRHDLVREHMTPGSALSRFVDRFLRNAITKQHTEPNFN